MCTKMLPGQVHGELISLKKMTEVYEIKAL